MSQIILILVLFAYPCNAFSSRLTSGKINPLQGLHFEEFCPVFDPSQFLLCHIFIFAGMVFSSSLCAMWCVAFDPRLFLPSVGYMLYYLESLHSSIGCCQSTASLISFSPYSVTTVWSAVSYPIDTYPAATPHDVVGRCPRSYAVVRRSAMSYDVVRTKSYDVVKRCTSS